MAPEVLPVIAHALPEALTARPQWVGWRFEQRADSWTKVPINPQTGRRASASDPASWSSFDAVLTRGRVSDLSGIGFVFAADDPFTGIDLDKCLDPETGTLEPWAVEIVAALDSYTERSPSGTGVHVIVRGALPGGEGGRRRTGRIEMYDERRYFTTTGHRLPNTPATVNDRHDALAALAARVFPEPSPAKTSGPVLPSSPASGDLSDAEVIRRAMSARNGTAFAALYVSGETMPYENDDSRADEALCCLLAFWTRDAVQIDRLFRRSGLYRDKWERADYRQRTIQRALDFVGTRFTVAHPAARLRPQNTPIRAVEIVGGRAVPR